MKKIIAVSLAACAAVAANAEGYQVNTLSARQGGMGHAGVALHLDSESQYFNPAGLGFMSKTLDMHAAFNGVIPSAQCKIEGTDTWYKTGHGMATPINANVAYSINDSWKIGLAFYTPYGSKIDWGMNWPGAFLNQKVTLSTFTFQPTLSWRILPNLSIGAGVTMSWGTVDLWKGLIDQNTYNKVLQAQYQLTVSQMAQAGLPTDNVPAPVLTDKCPASANLKGESALAWGGNFGIMWDVTKEFTLGASFRTTSWVKVNEGTAKVVYGDDAAQAMLSPSLNGMHEAHFNAKMPMPYVFSFGAGYRPTDRLTLALDAQLTGWKAYETLDVVFPQIPTYDQHLTKDYHNSWAVRLGGEYKVCDQLDARLGCTLDTSPINDEHYNPETPGMTKIEPSLGLSYHLNKHFSIDLYANYVAGLGADNQECDYEDLLVKAMSAQYPQLGSLLGSPEKTFKADYKVTAVSFGVGISYNF